MNKYEQFIELIIQLDLTNTNNNQPKFNKFMELRIQINMLIINMLIKTQVKRRTQSLNNYINSLKQKITDRHYKQAKHLLKTTQQSINNSYMAPYDPNAYLYDSLKTKNQKLIKQKYMIQEQIYHKLQEINKIKLRRSFTKNNNNKENTQNVQFIVKMYSEQVQVYVSKLPLKITDVQKINYQQAILQTNFHILRIIIQQFVITYNYSSIITIQADNQYILIKCKHDKNIQNNYVVLKFYNEEDRKIWNRCVNFCKLAYECQERTKLFFKEQVYGGNINPMQEQKEEDNSIVKDMLIPKMNKYLNLKVNANMNKTAIDRLHRKSQLVSNLPIYSQPNNNLNLINRRFKQRKLSQDLTMKQTLNRNSNLYQRKIGYKDTKSQRSSEEDTPPTSSKINKKQKMKKQYQKQKQPIKKLQITNNKIQKLIQQRLKLQSQVKLAQGNTSPNNKQIFFNQSSINWIQQQYQQAHSRSSQSKNVLGKKNYSQSKISNRENNQHIMEAPSDREESPLLPYSIRGRIQKQDKFQVRLKQVSTSGEKKTKTLYKHQNQNQNQSNQGPNLQQIPEFRARIKSRNMLRQAQGKQNSSEKEQQYQQQEEKSNNIESINQQSEEEESQSKSKKVDNKNTSDVQDKSQDLASQNQNSQTQSHKYGLDDLKSGILLLKCSPKGWKPHMKKVHLSNNDFELCWKNQKGDDLKRIKLSDIENIDYKSGTITQGILKHIKNIQKKRCLVIKYKLNNQIKLLQFYLPVEQSLQNLQNFYSKLNSYVKFKNNVQLQ